MAKSDKTEEKLAEGDMTEENTTEGKLAEQNLRVILDPQPLRRLLHVEESGIEHFEPVQLHEENLLSLLQRVDFGQTVHDDVKKESCLVQEWQWKGVYDHLTEAQMELNYLMDIINHVQGNFEVHVSTMNRPRQSEDEELKDKAICLMTKLQSFDHVGKYIKQSAKSLSQQVSREATFYGALMRLQRNWKVRQKNDRTAGSGRNAGFVIVLSDDALADSRLSFQLSSMCTVDLDQDSSGMLTANLPRHARLLLHVRYNHCQSGHQKWENIRKSSSSTSPACIISDDESGIRNQETDRILAKSIGEGVDEGSTRSHSIFRDILSEIFDAQVFSFLVGEISVVNVTGISENFLQFSLNPNIALTVHLESLPSNEEKESVSNIEIAEGDLRHGKNYEAVEKEGHEIVDEDGKNEGHEMDVETAGNRTSDVNMPAKSQEKYPNPLSSEVYLQQIVHQRIFGLRSSLRDRVMTRKTGATMGVGSGRRQETLSNNAITMLEHYCMTLTHRIFSYKVLDELDNMLQLKYLRLVSHPTWNVHTSAWFLYLAIPEEVTKREETKVWSDAQKKIRSQYYCKIVVHKELLTIEGGPIPCADGLFSGTSTEVWSTNEYSCGLADLTSFLLQQIASQIIYWLHEKVIVLGDKVKRDFLRLSFKVNKIYIVSLVATPDAKESNINWSLQVQCCMPDDGPTYGVSNDIEDKLPAFTNGDYLELESQFLGPLNLESLYEIVINVIFQYNIVA